jgi:hypothetical protein
MAKLTLNLNDHVVSRVKQIAKLRGVSVSAMVEAYLTSVAEPTSRAIRATPILRSLRGILKDADIQQYRTHRATRLIGR